MKRFNLANFLRRYLGCTLRRQLILSMALVHGVMISLFIWDLSSRHTLMMQEEESAHAQALAYSIATSAAGWVVARDYSGLQEIINAQARYPELRFAMILDPQGRVLAHSDTELINRYVTDLPARVEDVVLISSDAIVDVVSPILLHQQHVGWARVSLGQHVASQRISNIGINAAIYALVTIMIGVLIAWLVGTRMTRSLEAIRHCTDAIMHGDLTQRANTDSNDEVAYLARGFNNMLDSVARTQAELESSQERFDLAMQASNDGLWDWDLVSGQVYYSPRWKQILGYEDHELENSFEAWSRLVDDEGRTATMELIEQCRNGQRDEFKLTFSMQHKHGHWVDILTQALLVRTSNGQARRLVGTYSDISDRLKTEKSLRHAMKMRAVGELTGGIAHDFNNILGVIMGNLELLKVTVCDDAQVQRRLDIALSGTERGAALTRKLLNFSRGQAENLEQVDLSETIIKLQELMVRSLTPAIKVITELQQPLWPIEVDRGELEDTILNLIFNARDAMPEGGVLSLETSNYQFDEAASPRPPSIPPGDYVLLIISDTGNGIPKELQERIFEPFFTTKKSSKGTGLGLSMVYAFVTRQGGHVLLYSEENCGTTFRIYLPRSKKGEESDKLSSQHKSDNPVETGSETILIVDDEILLAEMAKDALLSLGYQVLMAHSAEQAIALLTSHKETDLIFSDVIMPGQFDGCELANLVHKYWPRTKVLLTSGFTGERQLGSNAERPHIDQLLKHLLKKPYTRRQLAHAIRETLDAPSLPQAES